MALLGLHRCCRNAASRAPLLSPPHRPPLHTPQLILPPCHSTSHTPTQQQPLSTRHTATLICTLTRNTRACLPFTHAARACGRRVQQVGLERPRVARVVPRRGGKPSRAEPPRDEGNGRRHQGPKSRDQRASDQEGRTPFLLNVFCFSVYLHG